MKKLLQKIKHHLGFTSTQENNLDNEKNDVKSLKNNIETTPSIESNSQKSCTINTKETTSYGAPNQIKELGDAINKKGINHDDKTVISELIKCEEFTQSNTQNYQSKDYTKYSFDGKHFYGKGRFVLEFIRNYINEHPNISFYELEKIFPPETHSRSLGVIRTLSHVNEMIATICPDWGNRFFLKKNDIITLKDNTKIVINSQWGKTNIENFLKIARKFKDIISK